ncbi:TadG family pilus assembly protein [Beijerinckia sp. L45]|uniref:TadG family pilus assembly protein n=1 Tax=Beijerinckia sp. L45 TaxID=1641855 RepID=UPI00131B27AC|nr:TadG family pilus assembly protein [Beijerinckia sp. L45]
MVAAHEFRANQRGTVAIIAGFAAFALVGATALSLDSAHFYLTKRNLQNATDLAAMAAAADITNAAAAAQATLTANGFPGALTSTTMGTYAPNPATPAASRFSAGGATPNAVRLATRATTSMIFGTIFSGPTQPGAPRGTVTLGGAATGMQSAVGAFAIGSRAASLDGGIANTVLSALTGATISLSAANYTSLVGAKIDMAAYARALATGVNLNVATYGDVLSMPIAISDATRILAAMPSTASSAVTAFKAAIAGVSGTITLGRVIDFGPYDTLPIAATPPIAPLMSAYDVIAAVVQVANGGHEVVADLGTSILGLAGVTVDIVIGNPPAASTVSRIASPTTAATNQIRLTVTAQVGVPGLVNLNLPIILDIAKGTATMSSLTCPSGQPTSASMALAVTPAVATLYVGSAALTAPGTLMPPVLPAPVITVGLVTVNASSQIAISNLQPTATSFAFTDVAAGTVKTVSTTQPLQTAVASLFSNLVVTVGPPTLLGGILGATATAAANLLGATVGTALQGVALPVDNVLAPLTRVLGIGVGQVDVWTTGMRCGAGVVVE